MPKTQQIKRKVKEHYTQVAQGAGCCGSECCGDQTSRLQQIGYDREALALLPSGSVEVGAGCGSPTALAQVRPGETVLDLGSGGGIDVLLAAKAAGSSGRVIGVDMTPAMIEKARANAKKAGATNVEFRLGEIEQLPVDDASVDLIISNCVINLSPDKDAVFREAHRVLKPGGRMIVSDLVTVGELSQKVRKSAEAWAGCIAGALDKQEYLEKIRAAGFAEVSILKESGYAGEMPVVSVTLKAQKA